MNEEGPKAGATTLRDRWNGRLAREWFDAPPGISSGDWHLFCAHTQQGKSLSDLQGMNATTFPTVDALRQRLAAVEQALVEKHPDAAAIVAAGFGEPEGESRAGAAPPSAVRTARAQGDPVGSGKG